MDRPGNKLRVTIRTSRPGIIIGRKGAEIEKLKQDLAKKTKREVFIDIQEVHKPELDAQLVAESIALQLEKRVAFRRAMRKAVDSALRFGCKGIKVRVSGRLNGAEIARSEWYLQGQLPLHTLRADIDYGFAQAYTTYGVIGVKCWTYKGEILEGGRRDSLRNEPEPRRRRCGIAARRRPPAAAPVRPYASRARRSCSRSARYQQPRRSTPILPPLGAAAAELEAGTEARNAPPAGIERRQSRRPKRARRMQEIDGRHNAMLMPKKVKYRKQQRGRMTGQGLARILARLWRLRVEGHALRLDHRPADRSRPHRHDALHQARRQGLDPFVSRTSRSPRSRPKPVWEKARAHPSSGWR